MMYRNVNPGKHILRIVASVSPNEVAIVQRRIYIGML